MTVDTDRPIETGRSWQDLPPAPPVGDPLDPAHPAAPAPPSVEEAATPKLAEVVQIAGKQERNEAEAAALEATLAELGIDDEHEDLGAAKKAFRSVMKQIMRQRVLDEGVRLDGRSREAGPALA